MQLLTLGLLSEIVPFLIYAIAAILLTAGGIAAEYSSLQYLSGGEFVVAAWLAVLGAIMLYAGMYAIGYQKLLARVT